MIKLAIAGAAGRMGRALIEACSQTPAVKLTAAIDRPDSALLGKDAGECAGVWTLGVPIGGQLTGADDFDVLIDFTLPEVTLTHLELCRAKGRRMVIGTTGFTSGQRAQISAAAQDVAIVFSPNMSVGVNLCLRLLETAARVLDGDVDISLEDAVHGTSVNIRVPAQTPCRTCGGSGAKPGTKPTVCAT
ncbi:MAG: 4-hydroxy-tetrahydrodipicolinate reductase, partial [Gammaproteobacteria bacterium]|nr:4-hydroxy-tetrahydrodipicolinate reductase [Gammaproteobacteria bacterium]